MYSLAVLYDVSAFTHRMNWSSAIRATGVRSRQLNGMPVWRGVVKRFDSVMTMTWASPFLALTSRKPSAPAPPDLFTTMSGRGDSLCFSARPEIRRAIWSAPPPVPAGTTNSIGLVGSHAPAGAVDARTRTSERAIESLMARLLAVCGRCLARCGPSDAPRWRDARRRRLPPAGDKRGAGPPRVPGPALRDREPAAWPPTGYLASSAALVASSRRNGTTAGISHFSHISSTFFWKYSRSSSMKWAKRPCLSRYSRTGFRARPSTIALVLP